MRLVITGPPGAGKGTQAAQIQATYDIPHISTGDMFRAALKSESELGLMAKSYMDRGELVPDKVTNDIVAERLQANDAQQGFLLDGYPRTKSQALALTSILEKAGWPLNAVLNIQADREKLIARIVGRRVCKSCGATYHVTFKPSKVEGVCDLCGGETYQRKDDARETVSTRLAVYEEQTSPLLAYYREQGLVIDIDGSKDFEAVFAEIKSKLAGEAL